jgi:type VI protein secretion system component VasA
MPAISSTPTTTPAVPNSSTTPIPNISTVQYSIDVLQDEARHLVEKGVVSRQQPIYVLCQYIPARDWVCVECELERCNFLLRDRIADLMGSEVWDND